MILIFSESTDKTTNKVIEWLRSFDSPFIRINDTCNIIIKTITIKNEALDFQFIINTPFHKEKIILYSDISCVWYRRGHLNIKLNNEQVDLKIISDLIYDIENTSLIKFIWYLFSKKPFINNYNDNSTNKLINLLFAKQVGLKIPTTSVTQIKNSAIKITSKTNSITKHISNFSPKLDSDNMLFAFTEQIGEKFPWSKYSDLVNPSLFQELLFKDFEVRAFYFDKKIYAMAIFSQKDIKTSVDFRKYNLEKPNRTIPFIMPLKVQAQIHKFMKMANLNCGSLDFVYTKKKDFVFLEVNPIGQFDQVSWPCNYNLEYIIAKKIKQYEEKAIS